MVIPVKVFEIKGDVDDQSLYDRLNGYRLKDTLELSDGQNLTLLTEILDLEQEERTIRGVFIKDILRERLYRRRIIETPTTEEVLFWITPFQDRRFLIVSAPSVARGVKKLLSNHVANNLSDILFNTIGAIVEVRISSETLAALHESNPQATNLIWFDDVDIPGVNKLCLAGQGLSDTQLYRDYLNHGKIWYVVFEIKKRGVTVGITRSCVVTLFSKLTFEEFIQCVTEDLLTLVE
jgi:hypothetical protein